MEIWSCGDSLSTIDMTVMFKKPILVNLSFVTWCFVLLELGIIKQVYFGHNGGKEKVISNTQLVLSGPYRPRKYGPHYYTTHQTRQQFSNL